MAILSKALDRGRQDGVQHAAQSIQQLGERLAVVKRGIANRGSSECTGVGNRVYGLILNLIRVN